MYAYEPGHECLRGWYLEDEVCACCGDPVWRCPICGALTDPPTIRATVALVPENAKGAGPGRPSASLISPNLPQTELSSAHDNGPEAA